MQPRIEVDRVEMVADHILTKAVDGGDLCIREQGDLPLKMLNRKVGDGNGCAYLLLKNAAFHHSECHTSAREMPHFTEANAIDWAS